MAPFDLKPGVPPNIQEYSNYPRGTNSTVSSKIRLEDQLYI